MRSVSIQRHVSTGAKQEGSKKVRSISPNFFSLYFAKFSKTLMVWILRWIYLRCEPYCLFISSILKKIFLCLIQV